MIKSNFAFNNVLFIDFSGLGNAFMLLPFFKSFESALPSVSNYYCQESIVFNENFFLRNLNITKLKAKFPQVWRRFNEENWEHIIDFIKKEKIDLLVNFRNLEPNKNKEYIAFKEKYKCLLDFWDYYVTDNTCLKMNKPEHVIESKHNLFCSKGVQIKSYDSWWLNKLLSEKDLLKKPDRKIALFTGASQKTKLWDANEWLKLISLILKETDYSIDMALLTK